MATNNDAMNLKLPAETMATLKASIAQGNQVRAAIESLKKLGMDTTAMEAQLDASMEQAETLITDFG